MFHNILFISTNFIFYFLFIFVIVIMEESTRHDQDPCGSDDSESTTEVLSCSSDSDTEEKNWAPVVAENLINPRSPLYNPTLVLHLSSDDASVGTGDTARLDASAPRYLNLETYCKAVKDPTQEPDTTFELKTTILTKKRNIPMISLPSSSSSASPSQPQQQQQVFPIPGRRFLPHQMPVYAPRIEPPDTIKVMATVEGPLSGLRVAMEGKKRIKVWTRRDAGIRGYFTGFIEAFDKHWNLALSDVDEVFCRRRRTKSVIEFNNYSNQKYKPELRQPDPIVTSSQRRSRSPTKPCKPVPTTSPTKKSKRIAARSRSQTSRHVMEADSSEDLVTWCRHKMRNLSLSNEKSKKAPSSVCPISTPIHTKSFLQKHSVTRFTQPIRDANGFVVIGVTQKMEIVERHVSQLFVMGNDIVMVETMQ